MIGSLFSGYGGLDLAAQSTFARPLAFVSDIEPGPCKILAHHYPDVPNLGDVTAVDRAPWRGLISVLTGGFPCQDVSTAGRRRGLIKGVTRSGLWGEMHRAITELRPEYVVIENVRGLLSAAADSDMEPCPWCVGEGRGDALRALGAVLGDLADTGYDARWCGLRASDVGACHQRFRVFVLAYPNGSSIRVEPVSESGRDGQAKPWEIVGDAAGHERWVGNRDDGHARDTNSIDREGWPASGLPRETRPAARPALTLLPTPRASDGQHGGPSQRGSSGDLALPSSVHQAFGSFELAIARHAEALGRVAPDPTEPAPRGGRSLSPRFVEWMMCLPDGWVSDVPGLTRVQTLRALGNGVVPPQAEAALRYLLAAPLEATA